MEQTQLIGHSSNNPEPNNDTKSNSSTDTGNESEISESRSSKLDSWTARHEAQGRAFGYLHLYAISESTLSGVDYYLRYEAEITHPASENSQSTIPDQIGWGRCSSKKVRELLAEWKLEKMALPFHPEIRDIPTERLQIFVSDVAREYLQEQGVEIDTLTDDLNQLPEHNPTDEQIKRRRECHELRAAIRGHDAWMKQRIHKIESTIRSRLKFSGRYESDTPEPDPEYDALNIAELKEKLETARNELEQAQQRKDELIEQINRRESRWIEQTRKDLL